MRRSTLLLAAPILALVLACAERAACRGEYCGTLVIVSPGEPDALLPALTTLTPARDVYDQLFLKLADVGPGLNTFGDSGFAPLLAERWQFEDPLTLVLHLDPRARWHDGRPVTAGDVAFSFRVTTDARYNSPQRSLLRKIRAVEARDSLAVVFRFTEPYAEQFYDAVYHLRVLPAHLLDTIPPARWASSAFVHRPVGSGPYRFVSWTAGQSLELVADSTFFLGRPHIRRLIWRYTGDPGTAVAQLASGEADALEVVVNPDYVRRLEAAGHQRLYRVPGSTYVYFGYNLRAPGDPTRPHALFRDAELRRALAMGVDRPRLAQAVFGDSAFAARGPVAQMVWISREAPEQLRYDPAEAARRLTALGWIDRDGDGIRERAGRTLSFHVIVPISSELRRRYARLLQEQFRAAGADLQIDELEFTVFSERAQRGRFDALLSSVQQDPSPSTYPQVWGREGVGALNYGGYVSPAFEAVVDSAVHAPTREAARLLWTRALSRINTDAPAIFLYAPAPPAAVHARVGEPVIRPDSWLALLRTWRIPPNRLIDRDRVER